MYHCSTMPMSAHIAAGMHGAVVIEPDGLPAVDRSYLLVQSEVHLDGDGRTSVREVDAASAAADTPDAVVFNGVANQYVSRPLTARVGDRVRFWVLAAGPNRGSSFHVVGTQFDTVWSEGAYLLRDGTGPLGDTGGGSQVLDLAAAQGGFVELTPREPGHYAFVTHVMADAERGARGLLSPSPRSAKSLRAPTHRTCRSGGSLPRAGTAARGRMGRRTRFRGLASSCEECDGHERARATTRGAWRRPGGDVVDPALGVVRLLCRSAAAARRGRAAGVGRRRRGRRRGPGRRAGAPAARRRPGGRGRPRRRGGRLRGVVTSFVLAFRVFTTDNVLGLFLCFAAGMLIGVVGPVVYQVWGRGRDLHSLGLGAQRWRQTVVIGIVLAATQFAVTVLGLDLPAPRGVGARCSGCRSSWACSRRCSSGGSCRAASRPSFGAVPAVAGAAVLYAAYHVGYGMGLSDMWFLLALGVVYAVAYRLTTNILVIWPLLTPVGAFFNNLNNGDIELPWASLLGFADVAVLMVVAIWLAHRHIGKVRAAAPPPTPESSETPDG